MTVTPVFTSSEIAVDYVAENFENYSFGALESPILYLDPMDMGETQISILGEGSESTIGIIGTDYGGESTRVVFRNGDDGYGYYEQAWYHKGGRYVDRSELYERDTSDLVYRAMSDGHSTLNLGGAIYESDSLISVVDEAAANVTLSTDIYSVSAAEAGDLSQALTFNDGSQTLSNYIGINGPI